MGVLRTLALLVLLISFLTLVLLFGQLPRLRKTPIGKVYRLLRYRLPALLSSIDRLICSSRLAPFLVRIGTYLINEPHPLVIFFYLTLVTGGIYIFISSGWSFLSPLQNASMYLASTSDPGVITPENHSKALDMYPYDHTIFFPPPHTPPCRSCHLQKPARSKHCSICKVCIAKQDHHCIWINNCVGLSNIRWFLLFLISTDVLLLVGMLLSWGILDFVLGQNGVEVKTLAWREYFRLLGLAIVEQVYVGAVFLLCALCGVLSNTFTGYHVYLIWAGTTSNETTKWDEWKDELRRGLYISGRWKTRTKTKTKPKPGTDIDTKTKPEQDTNTKPVSGLHEVDNIYDCGAAANFWDVVCPGKLE
ncbi:DHHC palmitoyltransferase-domain-containing protein [Pyronema omphalodes]|nr:DHHC palmitoyltransferase-domain-containing protein [Pyronema omphalodes]